MKRADRSDGEFDVEMLFAEALELPEAERAALLDELAARDSDLAANVRSLLRYADSANPLIDEPIIARLADSTEVTAARPASAPSLPDDFGPYHFTLHLGSGGFGEVYAAKQDHPVARAVAIKLIRADSNSKVVLARFERERRALAMMQHPNIATIFDAGTMPNGRPYFVMELIDGEPICEYCDSQNIALRGRIALMIAVCRAVEHAHRKAIVHRDLKAQNVLIRDRDGLPTPTVIDFGIAKVLDAGPNDDGSALTAERLLLGTPEYLSPEQADPAVSDIDTRSDVYSLGVMLYELLTGTTPFHDEARTATLDEYRRIIREVDPPRPSVRASTAATERNAADPHDHRVTRNAARRVAGDLDWIVMRCLEKDRERRYPSSLELAHDLQRYLDDEPVSAGPPSGVYRARKFVRRHRAAVASAAVAMLTVIVGLSWMTAGFVNARERNLEAQQHTAAQAALSDFFIERMLAGGADRRAIDVLLEPQQALIALATLPELEARVSANLARALATVARYEDALALIERAIELAPDDESHLEWQITKIGVLRRLGRFDTAKALGERHLAEAERQLASDDETLLNLRSSLAAVLWRLGENDRARDLFRGVVDTRVANGASDERIADARCKLALVLRDLRRTDEALALYRASIPTLRAHFPEDNPYLLTLRNNFATTLWQTGHHDESVAMLEEVYAHRTESLGPDHPDTMDTLANLAFAMRKQGKHEEAIPLLRRVLAVHESSYGPEHRQTLKTTRELATSLSAIGQSDEALRMLERVLAVQRRTGAAPLDLLGTLYGLASIARATGDHERACPLYSELVELSAKTFGSVNNNTFAFELQYEDSLKALGRTADLRLLRVAELARLTPAIEAEHPAPLALRRYAGVQLDCEFPELRDIDAAVAAAERWIALLDRVNPDAYVLASYAHLARGERTRAVDLLVATCHADDIDIARQRFEALFDAASLEEYRQRFDALRRSPGEVK